MKDQTRNIHPSGIKVSGHHSFVATFMKIVEKDKVRTRKWIEMLEKLGYKAAHPDDGWNDRENKEIHLCYPYFRYEIKVGDKIALGDPDKYKSVKVIGIRKGLIGDMDYFQYA